jgi:hypothetical protein
MKTVMAGLDPAIHDVPLRIKPEKYTQRDRVDGRVKSGHDEAPLLCC